ncbi:helix-turn-helix domain-containing protein [Faecalibacter macacae]|uniref:Helix-turn-helix domain-containing protein n=1 Tax=Faecalibacter macacae TaxID=1859289 RepID=A0A3L9M5E7_9FLAO|nr:helix-turn-helix domain-containing protein [Faecalibacter macacae]RLZ08052.1 helix-turn-helix domain-containing protein [Faecalibacter macacae]
MKFKIIFHLFFVSIYTFAQTNIKNESIKELMNDRIDLSYDVIVDRLDKAINLAIATNDSELISKAYLEKATFLYGQKKYKSSLENYLKSSQYLNSKINSSQYHTIQYGLALANQQIGNIEEAKIILLECYNYFKANPEVEDNKKALAAVLGRLTVLNILNKDIISAEKYNLEHLKGSNDKIDTDYALKNKGIIQFYKGNYDLSIDLLNNSLQTIINNKDVYWEMFVLYYLGENYYNKGDQLKAIQYYKKVKALYQKTGITDIVLRDNFLKLNNYYKEQGDKESQVEVINTLIEFDSVNYVVNQDVSQHYFNDYIKSNLTLEKNQLEKEVKFLNNQKVILLIIIIIIATTSFLVYKKLKKKNELLNIKVEEYLDKLSQDSTEDIVVAKVETISDSDKFLFQELEEKIRIFEDNIDFINSDVSLDSLAKNLNTNRSSLSKFINTYKHKNFRKYLNDLRINYIIKMLVSDKKYLNLTMDGLAEECGFNSRQKFSDAFLDTTSIRPKDFIKNLSEKALKQE